MNNPIEIYNDLLKVYLKYINSGLPFSHDELNAERNALLEEKGTICQPPIIELVPKYNEKATLEQFCRDENVLMHLLIPDFLGKTFMVKENYMITSIKPLKMHLLIESI